MQDEADLADRETQKLDALLSPPLEPDGRYALIHLER